MAPGHEYGNWLTLHGVKSGQIQIHSEGVGHRTSIDDMGVLWLFLCIYACEGRDSQLKNKTTTRMPSWSPGNRDTSPRVALITTTNNYEKVY